MAMEERERIGARIRKLAAHVNAASYRLLVLVARFDAIRGWNAEGYSSCAKWLAFHTGVDEWTAREQVRVAGALPELPLIRAAMARGELSFSAVQELTRVATPETEARLLEYARSCSVAELKRLLPSWRRYGRFEEQELARILHASRRLVIVPDGEGTYAVRARLMPEEALLLMRAVEAACDALYHRDDDVEPAQRRADALGLIAERALAAGFGGCAEHGPGPTAEYAAETRAETRAEHAAAAAAEADPGAGAETDGGTATPVRAEGSADAGQAGDAATTSPCCEQGGQGGHRPLSGTRAERFQVLIHVTPEALRKNEEGTHAELEDGTRLCAETVRRLACDASILGVVRGEDGSVLNVGRKMRTVSAAIRRALDIRDRGCRFPGCGLRYVEAHHIEHWSDGGETSLRNCLNLCRHHHFLVHEGGWSVRFLRGQLFFFRPDGMPIPNEPPRLRAGSKPVAALVQANRRRGVDPDDYACVPRYRRADDVPLPVVLRAMEAAAAGGPDVLLGRRPKEEEEEPEGRAVDDGPGSMERWTSNMGGGRPAVG